MVHLLRTSSQVITAAVLSFLTLLSSMLALFVLADCCRGKQKAQSQLATSLLALASAACMIGALAVGATADTAHMMNEFGGLGSAFYSPSKPSEMH